MAGVANDAFNYSKDLNEGIEEEEEEQIYNSIDDDSSLEDEIESIDKAIDSKIKSIKESKNLDLGYSNGGNTHETCSQSNGNGDNVIQEKLPIKKRRSTASSSKTHSYDEVTINFGKPVIPKHSQSLMLTQTSKGNNQDIFDSVCFTSPIEDTDKVIFRHSSIERGSPPLSDGNETSTSFYYEQPNLVESKNTEEDNSNRPPPIPTPRTSLPKLRSLTEYHNVELSNLKNKRTCSAPVSDGNYESNGRYEDIDSIDCDKDNIEFVNNNETKDTFDDENNRTKTVIIHPDYSDVHDFALSMVDKSYENKELNHKYTDVTIVPTSPRKVEIENILNLSHQSSDDGDKENEILVRNYSKPMDAVASHSVSNASIEHENIYTEIESTDCDDKNCDKSKLESLIDKQTLEQEEEEDILTQLGARPRAKPRTLLCDRSSTIDIRKEITSWYDEASKEVERDLSLDLDALDSGTKSNGSKNQISDSDSDSNDDEKRGENHFYEHVALQNPGTSCQLVNGKLIIQPKKPTVTLLRDFDPLLHKKETEKEKYTRETEDSSDEEDVDTYATESINCPLPPEVDGARANVSIDSEDTINCKREKKEMDSSTQYRHENIYSDSPILRRKENKSILDDDISNSSDRGSFDDRFDLPPPMTPPPPPPLPESLPPLVPRRHPPYENVWLGSDDCGVIKIESKSDRSNVVPIKTGSSSPIPVKPARPSIHRSHDSQSPSRSLNNTRHDLLRTAGASSDDEEKVKEDNIAIPKVLRQYSTSSHSTQISITEESENSVRSSASSHNSTLMNSSNAISQHSTTVPMQNPEYDELKSLDSMSSGKKSTSSISLSSLSKSFSRKSQVSQFASSVRRKFSENQSKYSMKNVLESPRRVSTASTASTTAQSLNKSPRNSFDGDDIAAGTSSRKLSLVNDMKKNHSGVLYLKSKKSFAVKWCVLTNVDFSYFNDKYSLAIPKEQISLHSILSISRHSEVETDEDGSTSFYTFDIAFSASPQAKTAFTKSPKYKVYRERTFGAATTQDRDTWIDRITQSLSIKLATFSMSSYTSYSRLCWAHMKNGFANPWTTSWVCVSDNLLRYTPADENDFYTMEEMNLKKVTNVTLVKDVKNLQAPATFPVLVIDYVDRSLYLMPICEKECKVLQNFVESSVFNNGETLEQQQLTKDGIPVIVDKCTKFIYSQGCLTQGIYRIAGVNKRITALLEDFRKNAWNVALNRDIYSEHDVANVLKRFMRTLKEPLLTQKLRSDFIETSKIEDTEDKLKRYIDLLSQLPRLNYDTLRRLIIHLRAVSDQSETNLMNPTNLSALWGPTLMTVDSQVDGTGFNDTSYEAEVCINFLDHFLTLFNVDPEELKREEDILEVLKKVHLHDKGKVPLNPSGDLKMWVYIDSKSGGRCVQLVVYPKMTAIEMVRTVMREIGNPIEAENHILHEVVLQGHLERPIHYKEVVFETTLKWGTWPEQDRRDNYLLLKKINPFYEEALPYAIPPLSVFGEARYGGNSKKKQLSGFKKHQFSISNARIVCTKPREGANDSLSEVDSWPIEDIWWYFGCEPKRQAPFHFNLTFISKEENVERNKDRPYFGNTISFENRDLFTRWIAAMLVSEHSNDLKPPPQLLLID